MFCPGGMAGGAVARTGTSADDPPEAARPDRVIRVALLELDPDLRSDRRHHEAARLDAGDRHTRHRPARRDLAQHVRHLHHDAADLLAGRR